MDKADFKIESNVFGIQKTETHIESLYDLSKKVNRRIDNSVVPLFDAIDVKISKLDRWKTEIIEHFERSLPFSIAKISFDVSASQCKKKRQKGLHATHFTDVLKALKLNEQMSSLTDYSQMANTGLGLGIRGGQIYECPYGVGKHQLPSDYKLWLGQNFQMDEEREIPGRVSKSSHQTSKHSIASKLSAIKIKKKPQVQMSQTLRQNPQEKMIQALKVEQRQKYSNTIQHLRTQIENSEKSPKNQ